LSSAGRLATRPRKATRNIWGGREYGNRRFDFSAADDLLERRRRRSRSPSGVVADSFTQRKNVMVNLITPRRQ
jgi:hypothetical protein